MRILVTGGAGYIGSVTVAHLLDRGHAVAAIDNLSSGHRQAVDARAVFVEGDVGDAGALGRLFDDFHPDAVMHLAAVALVSESMKAPGKYYRENVDKGRVLLETMTARGVTDIVFSSTAAVYGEPRRIPIQETDPLEPTNTYGETKLAFERMLRWFGVAHGLRFCALRYFNAAGCTATLGEEHEPETHIIPRVLGVALGRWPEVEVFGTDYDTRDGSCVRDYVHIVDLAEAHEKALASVARGESPGIVNLGNGQGYSVLEVVQTAEKVTGRPIPHRTSPRRPGDPATLVASSQLARQRLGWTPRHPDLESIVASAWRWHQANPHGYR
jgi:UDP-glucose 4-epimerase